MTAKEVASWAKKAREATARRDEAIRQMHVDGATLRAIGEAAGLSHTAIKKILVRARNEGRETRGSQEALNRIARALASVDPPIGDRS